MRSRDFSGQQIDLTMDVEKQRDQKLFFFVFVAGHGMLDPQLSPRFSHTMLPECKG